MELLIKGSVYHFLDAVDARAVFVELNENGVFICPFEVLIERGVGFGQSVDGGLAVLYVVHSVTDHQLIRYQPVKRLCSMMNSNIPPSC